MPIKNHVHQRSNLEYCYNRKWTANVGALIFVFAHTYVRFLSPVQRYSYATAILNLESLRHAEHTARISSEIQQSILTRTSYGRIREVDDVPISRGRAPGAGWRAGNRRGFVVERRARRGNIRAHRQVHVMRVVVQTVEIILQKNRNNNKPTQLTTWCSFRSVATLLMANLGGIFPK